MFGWLQDLLRSIVDAITGGFASAAKAISDSIWNAMMRWLYNSVYSAIADFFTMMGNMGAEIFDLAWIRAIVQLFTLFGWGLFTAGAVVAIFDLAVEYQSGRANIKNTLLNILKGFFACSLIGLVPIELYKFCISLQNTFAGELARIFSWQSGIDFSSRATDRARKHVRAAESRGQSAFERVPVNRVRVLRDKGVFSEYQARGNPACTNVGRFAVYVFRAERVY